MASSTPIKPKFRTDGHRFIIENYNHAYPFASFFPALAGETGKPMWVFYTNRGQAISSFGVNNKDGSMLEFLPANKAYQATPFLGFRTFLRPHAKDATWYEPFSMANHTAQQTMVITPYDLELREVHPKWGLEIQVRYFGIPHESCALLARSITIRNTSRKPNRVALFDGLPRVVPWGMGDYLVKNMSRTIEAFAEVTNKKSTVPFFKLKVEPDDKPNVQELKAGFFSFTVGQKDFMPVVVDPTFVFGQDSSFLKPSPFVGLNGLSLNGQLTSNIMPSSFFYSHVTFKPQEERTWCSYFGQAENESQANAFADKIKADPAYFEKKHTEMKEIYENLVKKFGFRSHDENLNAYASNTFMDNVLRGGFPLSLTPSGPLVHVFSRKHGDMERDYNQFHVSATYFSQGNGNFRDVNQNRRHDLYLNPKVGSANIEFFFNLLQLDGYNPLVINPLRFSVPRDLERIQGFKHSDEFKAACYRLRKQPVLPGVLYEFILKFASDRLNVNNLFQTLIQRCHPHQGIQHGEGFWVDHWIYNLDHLDQYFGVYPDRAAWLLFEKKDFTFHDSDHFVQPRKEKYVLTKNGQFRQLNSVVLNSEKQNLIRSRKTEPHKVRTQGGEGGILTTTLFGKLVALAVVKTSSLDPYGMGIEMDADKPGWCDALNGAPGLFGSSTHEMFELKRLVEFLLQKAVPLSPTKSIDLPQEVGVFLKEVSLALSHVSGKDFRPVWDKMTTAREHFREKTFFGVSGKTRSVKLRDIEEFLKRAHRTLGYAEKNATDPKTKLPTSYYTYHVEAGALPSDWRSHAYKIPWKQHRVTSFLEGAVHAMKMSPPAKAKKIYKAVKKSALADKKLGMYRLNTSMKNESQEIGRIRIFSEGWLENESIFLHMHYKYLLEILRSGLTKEFFDESKRGLIPFRDMKAYGRPIFENSSFLASSHFPKKEVHGKGFVARLSGATSEFLSMIYFLVFGSSPFQMEGESIHFAPTPQLPAAWFTKKETEWGPKNSLSLTLFGVPVTFINAKQKNSFGPGAVKPVEFEWISDGRFYTHSGSSLPTEPSLALREGRLESVTVFLGR